MSGLDGLGWPNPKNEPKPKKTMNSQLEIKLATKMTDTPHDHDHNEMTPLDHALAHNKQLTHLLERLGRTHSDESMLSAIAEIDKIYQTKTMETELQIWKSRAEAHEENYLQMLKRIDAAIAERDLWKAETKRWRDMYIEYDEMLEQDLEKAKKRITNVMAKIKELDKQMNDKNY